ncbi:DUF2808 domain-containing protein [Myxosarcina sp. GI1(2024)]
MSLTIPKTFRKFTKKNVLFAGSLALAILLPSSFSSAKAFELGDGRRVFSRAPILTRSATSFSAANTPATYQFTIKVPEDADEALKAVTISPKQRAKDINFDVSDSRAFMGDSFAGGTELSLANIGGSQMKDSNEVTVVFDEPIEPGNTVTVSLEAKKNPNIGGVYLFGVTAFPEGENSPGLYLGSGRVHVYQN